MPLLLVLLLALSSSVFAQSSVENRSAFTTEPGVQGEVNAIAIQPDGKVIIGGRFNSVNGQPRGSLARLNPDGTLDMAFANSFEAGVNGQVFALALQADGSVIVGGTFTQANSFGTYNIARYKADGTVDQTFGAGNGVASPGTDGPVFALAIQPDGKVVLGGSFSLVLGQPRRSVARLNADGTLDAPVVSDPQAVSGTVKSVVLDTKNALVAGGRFSVQKQTAQNLLKTSPAGN
ncbi:delta-60 repeat domain-containing protein [Terrimicrobium sacchariphilum]|uniref:Delta-60 repeat domain-containing protein n=1 Tax=Terrimicrobium sacchariphilum TaxID=690879 RepID=A0A146G8K0_TERSA|nr:delta-60 repeat domain-containing protein [Terrimicrobium sacchariphilum]GAT34025.1 delta-60 repeat domain-containing protein [Terrimicrobium sacchariphilum]